MRATEATPLSGVEVYDVDSGLGGHFSVSIIQNLENGDVVVQVWYGEFTNSGWKSYGLLTGKPSKPIAANCSIAGKFPESTPSISYRLLRSKGGLHHLHPEVYWSSCGLALKRSSLAYRSISGRLVDPLDLELALAF
jgi:hypothetical protein